MANLSGNIENFLQNNRKRVHLELDSEHTKMLEALQEKKNVGNTRIMAYACIEMVYYHEFNIKKT